MNQTFCCDIKDDKLDVTIFYDFECELEIDAHISGGEPEILITDIILDGRSMFGGDDLTVMLAHRIKRMAETTIDAGGALWSAILEEAGIQYVGRGGGDPDGFYRYAA